MTLPLKVIPSREGITNVLIRLLGYGGWFLCWSHTAMYELYVPRREKSLYISPISAFVIHFMEGITEY